MVASSMAAMERMLLAGCSCVLVWAFSLPWNFVFCTLSQIQCGCVASVHNVHLRGRSKQVAPRVCFIQELIQDEIINAKQCPTAVQIT